MIPRIFFLLLACALMVGCGRDSIPYTDTTPEGYRVNIPESVYEHGLYLVASTVTDESEVRTTILEWVDSQVADWIFQNSSVVDTETLKFIASRKVFKVIDDYGFPCEISSTGLCNGAYSESVIYVSLYEFWSYDTIPLFNYPPHTLRTGMEMAQWLDNNYWLDKPYIVGEIGFKGLYSIPHELNHALYGNYH